MSLTKEQVEIRATGIGASEAAIPLEMHPSLQPVDLWLAKTGRAGEDSEESAAAEIGSAVEDGVRALYTKRTGVRMDRIGATLRHPLHREILASPDGLSPDEDGGLEIKTVGFRMAHHWEDDAVPDYVEVQARQNMAVTGRSWWDVAALLGTELRIHRVFRDVEVEESMLEALISWWADHVVADVAPPALDPDARRRWLRARYPGSTKTSCRRVEDPDVDEAMRWLDYGKRAIKVAEAAEKQLENALCELVGDDYGIEGAAGKFLWFPKRGNPSWKDIAHELAGGSVADELVEKHRGAPGRSPALYMAKAKDAAAKPRGKRTK